MRARSYYGARTGGAAVGSSLPLFSVRCGGFYANSISHEPLSCCRRRRPRPSGIISGRRQKGECESSRSLSRRATSRCRYFAPIILVLPLSVPPLHSRLRRARGAEGRTKINFSYWHFWGILPRSFPRARGAHDSREGYNSQYYNETGSGSTGNG